MPLTAAWLPMATPLDPAEEPPGSLDPLGTLNYAERLAEVLLPAFTVRMWRARLLTFAVVAATVADRAVARMEGREDIRLEARLAFERLFVSAMVRLSAKEPEKYGGALPRLPGRDLANKAWLAGEPLTPANFLKGQAVNGPFGVIARLARQVELVDADGCVGRNATSLLIAWSEDEQISGVLDEDGASTRAGAGWMNDAVKTTIACVSKREWPGASHRIWEQLAMHLRPDQIGLRERRALLQMLEVVPVRRRLFWILKNRVDLFLDSRQLSDRGRLERAILLDGVRPELGKDPVDCLIADVIAAADTYEQTTSLLQQAFDGLIWSLKNRGGRATPKAVLSDERLCKYLERTRLALSKTVPRLCQTMNLLRNQPLLDTAGFVEPLARLHEEVVSAEKSEASLAQVVLSRHGRVQREKAKAPWIESEAYWTLMPGENRISGDVLPVWSDKYLHPFKISNAYRRNREIASVIDFYNHETSAPRKLILDATSFVRDVSGFVRASGAAVERFRQAVEGARSRIRDWRSMPADFKLRETPRAIFVGGLPRRKGGMAQSPLDQLINQWGNRRAEEITVMTPFVGDLEGPVDPVVERLMQLPRARGAAGYLVVPGQPSERDSTRMVVGLPRRFLVAWASAWRRDPNAVDTYVVPLCRQGEKANRDLHAKGVLVAGDGMEMLLCGSSNFSPHGMGIGVANAEAILHISWECSSLRSPRITCRAPHQLEMA